MTGLEDLRYSWLACYGGQICVGLTLMRQNQALAEC